MVVRNGTSLAAELSRFQREFDSLLDGLGLRSGRWPFALAPAYPPLNVWDCGEALCVEAELPGVQMSDLEIYAAGNELSIKGKRQPAEREGTYHRQERPAGEFSRIITLPADVDHEKVEAVLKDGVLSIRLPKAEGAKPRRIPVKMT